MSRYYNNIEDCPLKVFRLVQTKQSLEPLLVEGEYKEEEANEAWLQLYDEYSEAVQSKSNNISFSLRKQLIVSVNEYNIVKNCLFLISEKHNLNLINMDEVFDYSEQVNTLNTMGYKFNVEKVSDEVGRVSRQLNMKKKRIETIKQEIERIEKKGGSWTFTDTIGSVEKFMGFQIDQEKTNLSLFISYLNQLLKQPKQDGKSGRK